MSNSLPIHLPAPDGDGRVGSMPEAALSGAAEDGLHATAELVQRFRRQLAALRLEHLLDARGGDLLDRESRERRQPLAEEALEGSTQLRSVLEHPPIEQFAKRHRDRFLLHRLEPAALALSPALQIFSEALRVLPRGARGRFAPPSSG